VAGADVCGFVVVVVDGGDVDVLRAAWLAVVSGGEAVLCSGAAGARVLPCAGAAVAVVAGGLGGGVV